MPVSTYWSREQCEARDYQCPSERQIVVNELVVLRETLVHDIFFYNVQAAKSWCGTFT